MSNETLRNKIETKTKTLSLDTKEKNFLLSKDNLRVKDINNILYQELLSRNIKISNDPKIKSILNIENFSKYPLIQNAMKWRFSIIENNFAGNANLIYFYKNITLSKILLCNALRSLGQGKLAAEIDTSTQNASNFLKLKGGDLSKQIFSASFIKCLHKFQSITNTNDARSPVDCVLGPKTIQALLSYSNYKIDAQKEVGVKLNKKFTKIDYANKDIVQKKITLIESKINTKDIHILQGYLSELNTIALNTNVETVEHSVDPLRKKIIDKIIILASLLPPLERKKIINNMDNVVEGDSKLKKQIKEAKKSKEEIDTKNEYDDAVSQLEEDLKEKGVNKDFINSLMAKIQKIITVYGINVTGISKIEEVANKSPELFNAIISTVGPLHKGLKSLAQNPLGRKLLTGSQAIGGAFQWVNLYDAAKSGDSISNKVLNVASSVGNIAKYMIPVVGNVFDFNDAHKDFQKGEYGSCCLNLTTGVVGMGLDLVTIFTAGGSQLAKIPFKTGMKIGIKGLKEGKGALKVWNDIYEPAASGVKAIGEGVVSSGKYIKELATNPKAMDKFLTQNAGKMDNILKYLENAPKMAESALLNLNRGKTATNVFKYLLKETIEGVINQLTLPLKLLFSMFGKSMDIKSMRKILKGFQYKNIKSVKGNPFGSPNDIDQVSPKPTPTNTVSPKPTPTNTVSPKPTPTNTVSPKPTPTNTVSPKPTPTNTVSPKLNNILENGSNKQKENLFEFKSTNEILLHNKEIVYDMRADKTLELRLGHSNFTIKKNENGEFVIRSIELGESISLKKGESVSIGRNHSFVTKKFEDKFMSGSHLKILIDGGGKLHIEDLNSTNKSILKESNVKPKNPNEKKSKENNIYSDSQKVNAVKNNIDGFDKVNLSSISQRFLGEFGGPHHKVEFDGHVMYMTDIIQVEDRKFLVGYNNTGEVRMFYRSGSESEWRSCPGVRGDHQLSKGEWIPGSCYETTTKIKQEINNFFDTFSVIKNTNDPIHYSMNFPSVKDIGFGSMETSTEFNIEGMIKETTITRLFKKYSMAVTFYKGKTIDQVKLDYKNLQVDGLDLKSMKIDSKKGYTFYHDLLESNVNVDVVDMNLNGLGITVHFARADDRPDKVFITNIIRNDAKINSFGMYDKQLNAGPLTAKPIDYEEQVPYMPNSKTFKDGIYRDIRDLYQETPLIKEYKARIGILN